MAFPSLDSLAASTTTLKIAKAAWIQLVTFLSNWFATLPDSAAGSGGRVVVVRSAADGLGLASDTDPADFNGATVSGFVPKRVRVTASAITINAASTDVVSGAHLTLEASSAQTATFAADLPEGWTISWDQAGTGQVTFVAGSGATLRHRLGHTKTAGRWAVGGVRVTRNNGSTVDLELFGDTAS